LDRGEISLFEPRWVEARVRAGDLVVLGNGAVPAQRCIQAPVFPEAVPPPIGKKQESKVEGLRAGRDVTPD
jgi:hypothetical protein